MTNLSLRDKILIGVIALCVVASVVVLSTRKVGEADKVEVDIVKPEVVHTYLYDICIDSLNVITSKVKSGESLSTILDRYGITVREVYQISQNSKNVYDFRAVKGGNKYTMLMSQDSLAKAKYFIYEASLLDYVVVALDSTKKVTLGQKELTTKRAFGRAAIESSLWNAMVAAQMSGTLAMNISDVYQWSIDFFGIQEGDAVKVIYDKEFVEGNEVGVGAIHGAEFTHQGHKYYAIRYEYEQNGKKVVGYWDEEGKSLKSAFLKAPLRYSRISSKFSYSRLHPVLRIRRPHLGVDYAAPSGTPVYAIGDGVITHRAYAGGNGNYIKIKHAMGFQSGYLHLRGFAKGIVVGKHVSQGDLIGYVGSTGISTGPHLDFRIWKNGTAIDPLKMSQQKGKDIDASLKGSFDIVKSKILAQLSKGELIDFPVESDSTRVEPVVIEQN